MANPEGEVRAADSGGISKVHEGPIGPRLAVQCACGHRLFDGIVVRSRVVRLLPRGGAEALCRCKRWQTVPLTYDDTLIRAATGVSTNPGVRANLIAKA